MDIDEIQKALNLIKQAGVNVAGDLVLKKDVQYEVGNVEDGGIGIQINQYGIKGTNTNDVPMEDSELDKERPLCVALNKAQRIMLEAAEQKGIIVYNNVRKGYDKGALASQALVAYLCGKIFCGDETKDGAWMEGKRFDDAQYCELLFGFDVAGTRRSTRGKGGGKSPIGWEKIDELFAEN